MLDQVLTLRSDALVPSAWEYPISFALPQSRIKGNGHSLLLDYDVLEVSERPDLMALALGEFDGSVAQITIDDLTVQCASDIERHISCDGVVLRGSARVRNLLVMDPAGIGPAVREVFGFRITQHDPGPEFFVHGGHDVEGLTVRSSYRDSYVSAVCVDCGMHTDRELAWSSFRNTNVILAPGNQSGLTALRRVHFKGGSVSGVLNGYYCDTGTMSEIVVEDYRFTVDRVGCGLRTLDGKPKGNITFRNCDFFYRGEGNAYAFEAFDDAGLIENVYFDGCRFFCPQSRPFYAFSTTCRQHDVEDAHLCVRFNRNCILPRHAAVYSPRWSQPFSQNLFS